MVKRPFHTCACGDHAFLEVAAKECGWLVDLPMMLPKLAQHKWCLSGANPPYASTTDREKLAMHRVILEPARQQEVDHRQTYGGWINRRSNLRLCTRAENNCNRRCHSTTGFKGVQPRREEVGSAR